MNIDARPCRTARQQHDAMMSLLAPEAGFAAADGTTVTDRAHIAAQL
jgi:hypothetical protein